MTRKNSSTASCLRSPFGTENSEVFWHEVKASGLLQAFLGGPLAVGTGGGAQSYLPVRNYSTATWASSRLGPNSMPKWGLEGGLRGWMYLRGKAASARSHGAPEPGSHGRRESELSFCQWAGKRETVQKGRNVGLEKRSYLVVLSSPFFFFFCMIGV